MRKEWQIAHSQEFPLELGRAPKKVQKAYPRAMDRLRESPDGADGSQIRRLVEYKDYDLWRLRISDDYRLIYKLDPDELRVTLLLLDHRTRVYDRIMPTRTGGTATEIAGKTEELLHTGLQDPKNQPGEGAEGDGDRDDTSGTSNHPDRPLPLTLSKEVLRSWGIDEQYGAFLEGIGTENELLARNDKVPAEILERVFNGLWPPTVAEMMERPERIAESAADIEAAATGERSLMSFMLPLDRAQRDFVNRFRSKHAQGPWLVKGGPGSGKTTIALYCIKELIQQPELGGSPPEILYATFTRSLVQAADQLWASLPGVDRSLKPRLEIHNVDSLATRFLSDDQKQLEPAEDSVALRAVESAMNSALTTLGAEYVLEEINWVICGQGLETCKQYQEDAKRAGRRRRLDDRQREQLWSIWEQTRRTLRQEHQCLFSERLMWACKQAPPSYDYVFIDEAQDLKQVAIRLLIRLSKSPRRVLVTADNNQTIYGNKLSWKAVAEDLNFKGKGRLLRRNYRQTREIWDGASQIPSESDADPDTLTIPAVSSGPRPIRIRYRDPRSQASRLNRFLREALVQERVAPSAAAVLCPTRRSATEMAGAIDASLNPRMMVGELDLTHPGVKVLTIHGAKGVDFPVVAVVDVEDGLMPAPPPAGGDDVEFRDRQRRLLFVACTRAMRRLAVFASSRRPSPFTSDITPEYWDFEDI
jgi:mRNA-degrading endonuclease RelE of RelBE toxin-antitoxin system